MFSWNSVSRGQHPLLRGSDAPGVLAFKRLVVEPGIGNHDQCVRIIVPEGGQISSWQNGHYSDFNGVGSLLGMRVGPVYLMQVEVVLKGLQQSVYPTVEMLDRLYPPPGLETLHPVKLVITNGDIENALTSGLVTKVIYLENPDTALPYRQQFDHQAEIDVGPGQDPFAVADRLGRPMAILRIGSRQPVSGESESLYQYGPIQMFESGNVVHPISSADVENMLPSANDSVNGAHSSNGASHANGASQASWQVCCPQAPCPTNCDAEFYQCDANEVAKLPKSRRDEYVCDGNDRDLRVVADSEWNLHGLDIEDTIAHYDTLDGKVLIAPSNRVCIYSPRFASVRRILKTNYETITQRLTVSNDTTPVAAASGKAFSTTTLQNVQLQANRKTESPLAFRDQTRGVVTENRVKLYGARHAFKPFEDLQLIRFGKFSSSESARLTMALQSAVAWGGAVSAQITINNNQPVIVRDVSRAQELMSIESDTNPDLRLCKLASRISAQSGDTVDFTIRFDNIGREKIGNVTVIDNLSPRLEYIDGTAECSREAEFSTSDNEAGSLKLRWEISAPLNVGDGGLIRFQCRVR